MKAVKLSKVKDGGSFKRAKAMRAVWWKKIKKIKDNGFFFICTSTNSERSVKLPLNEVVYVKD